MNPSCLCLAALSLVGLCATFTLDAAEPARHAQNPILWVDVPDMAVLRVGGTYYMSSTTMHLSPGLPLMKSKDLVKWELVGYAYDTLADNDALTLSNGKSAYGCGVTVHGAERERPIQARSASE
jgi:beta-xylosidase